MSTFSYFVSRYTNNDLYEIDARMSNNEKLVLEGYGTNYGSTEFFNTIFHHPRMIDNNYPDIDKLLAYLKKCDLNDVLSGKDEQAYLTTCIIRNDYGLLFDVNGLIQFDMAPLDKNFFCVNFKIIRYVNKQAVEFVDIHLSKDAVIIDELKDRNASSVKRSLRFSTEDLSRINITEYS